jgi:hypothetical protein
VHFMFLCDSHNKWRLFPKELLTFNAGIKSLRATLLDEIFLLGILLLEPCISLIYAWKTNKCNNYSFSLLTMYSISYMFRHYISILRERGAWRTQITTHNVTRNNTPIHNILSTAPQLSISQKALGTLPEDGNIMPKHVGDTIHN